MKITVNGDVTPGAVRTVLEDLEREYSLKIRDITMYVRLIDESGRVVDPKLPANGSELVRTVSREETRNADLQNKQLSIEQLKELLELHIGRPLIASELERVALWVKEYHVTYGEVNYAIGLYGTEQLGFRLLDRWIYTMFKARREQEILKSND